jgi:hypothetical protein
VDRHTEEFIKSGDGKIVVARMPQADEAISTIPPDYPAPHI